MKNEKRKTVQKRKMFNVENNLMLEIKFYIDNYDLNVLSQHQILEKITSASTVTTIIIWYFLSHF